MNKEKFIIKNKLLKLGVISTILIPLCVVVSCSDYNVDIDFKDELIHLTPEQSPINKDQYYLIKSYKSYYYHGGFGGSIEISEQYYKELGGK